MASPQVCPILSTGLTPGTDATPSMCLEEDCALYLKSYKACSIYILAYNAALDIKKKQQ